MPFDASGNFTRVMNWTNDYNNGIEIVCDRHDDEDDNFAAGFNECFCRDGRATATGSFKMGGYKITGMGDGVATNDAINKGQLTTVQTTLQNAIDAINTALAATNFIGDIKASVRNANHGDWILCDGQAISRTDYADLFDLIGTTYGSGDGSTTFNVPDFSDIVLPTATTIDVKGTGKTLGLTNGTDDAGLIGDTSSYNHHIFRKTAIDKNVSTSLSGTSEGAIDGLIGVATDAAKSGLTGDIVSTKTMNFFIKAL